MIAPIDPSMVLGPQAAVAPVQDVPSVTGAEGSGGFGGMLTKAVQGLEDSQVQASKGAAELAAGTAASPEAVVMGVEKAKLSMQMAATLRTKGVEAMNDILHTQV